MSKQELPTVPCHPPPKRSNRVTAVDYPSERATANMVGDYPSERATANMVGDRTADQSQQPAGDDAHAFSTLPLEDHWLGKPDPGTWSSVAGLRPPEPPRALIDPEPEYNEDPRDFELPLP